MTTAQRSAREVRALFLDHDGRGPEYALLECAYSAGCRRSTRIDYSAGRSDAELILLFEAKGWTVSPTRCPDHASVVAG